jgi:hypothetical protein
MKYTLKEKIDCLINCSTSIEVDLLNFKGSEKTVKKMERQIEILKIISEELKIIDQFKKIIV